MKNNLRAQATRGFSMRINDAFLDAIDELRKLQPDLPTRTEMIIRLVEAELKRIKEEKQK